MINIWELTAIYFTIVLTLGFVFGLYVDDEGEVILASLLWPITILAIAFVGVLYLIYAPVMLARHIDKRLTPQERMEKNDDR